MNKELFQQDAKNGVFSMFNACMHKEQCRAAISQPANQAGETVHQILQGYPGDPGGTWRDASKTSYDRAATGRKRTLYTTPQPALQAKEWHDTKSL